MILLTAALTVGYTATSAKRETTALLYTLDNRFQVNRHSMRSYSNMLLLPVMGIDSHVLKLGVAGNRYRLTPSLVCCSLATVEVTQGVV